MSGTEALPSEDGWTLCGRQEGFSSVAGPYWERAGEAGAMERAIRIAPAHLNPEGVVHGGVLTSFADYILYRAIGDVLTHTVRFATVTLTCNFLAAGRAGALLRGQGRIVRRTRSLIFAEGVILDADQPVLTASGVYKIIGAG